jgi:hypothetical protein
MNRYFSEKRWSVAAVLVIVALITCGARAAAVTDEQKAKPDQTDKYIEQLRQQTGEYYANQLAEVRAHKEDRERLFSISNPELFIPENFVGWSEYVQAFLDLRGIDLCDDPKFAGTFEEFRHGGLTTVKRFDLAPKLLAIAEDRLAKEENRALRGYETAELQLEKERNYALNVQLPQLAEQLRNNALNPSPVTPAGVVSGIVYSADRPAALVGTQIVHKGESIGGVRVVKIEAEAVTFEKGGRTWTQKIGETPPSPVQS